MINPFHAGKSKPNAMEACYAAQRITFGPVVFQTCRALRDLGVLRELHRHPEGITLAALRGGTDLSRYALMRDPVLALTLLVIACPGALVISTPISVIAGIGHAAQQGILIKAGEYLETAGRIRAVAFDKIGTLTVGRPEVASVIPLDGLERTPDGDSDQKLLHWAAMAESGSEHPLARAVFRALEHERPAAGVDDFETVADGGISARPE